MKFLFIVQGEGRGHMTQAISLSQVLETRGHIVSDVFLGTSPQRKPPEFFVSYFGSRIRYFKSPNFKNTLDRKGIISSILFYHNLFRCPVYIWEIFKIAQVIKKSDAERVINFYDIIGGLAGFFSFSGKKCYVISHHFFFQHPDFGWPEKISIQKWLLLLHNFFCALGAERKIALSFSESKNINAKRIVVTPPLLRKELYKLNTINEGFILVYLLNSGFLGDIIKWCKENPFRKVVIFLDKVPETGSFPTNVEFEHLQGEKFIHMLSTCELLFCTAGFETVAEAAFLGKRILVIPSKNHYEQKCNALDAEKAGIAKRVNEFDIPEESVNLPGFTSLKSYRSWVLKNPGIIIKILEQ